MYRRSVNISILFLTLLLTVQILAGSAQSAGEHRSASTDHAAGPSANPFRQRQSADSTPAGRPQARVEAALRSSPGMFIADQHVGDVHFSANLRLLSPLTAIIVTSATDSGPGSLRQALLRAAPGAIITFVPSVFPPGNPMTITLLSALPEINQGNLTIDASNAGVVLDGRYTPSDTGGLRITSDGNVIKGLQIIRFPGNGVEITNGAKNNTIGGDWTVGGAPHGEGNVITLNGDDGVDINGTGTMSNVVSGNLIGLDLDGTRDIRVQAMAISPGYANDQTLFIGMKFHGVWKTTDGGSTWGEVNTDLSILDVRALVISPDYVTDGTLFAGTANGGIFKTINKGGSWRQVDGGETSSDVVALAISPDYANDGHIFAATESDDVFASTDGGDTWVARSSGLTDTRLRDLTVSPNYSIDHTLYAAVQNTIFKSVDQGVSWTVVSNGVVTEVNVLSISPYFANDQTLFVGTHQCGTGRVLWKSTDGGASWESANNNPGWCHTRSLVVSPNYVVDQTLFAGGISDGIFKSNDGGDSWAEVQTGLFNGALSLSPDYAEDHTLFAGRGSGTILKSTNGGGAWTDIGTALTEQGNNQNGVRVCCGAQGNTIGGDSPGERNVISNNADKGVFIHDPSTTDNIISGNYIGTDSNGATSLGNGWEGVAIIRGAKNNRVGGAVPDERNIISSNEGMGVGLENSDTLSNIILGNYIGTDASGTVALGNAEQGVYCGEEARNNIILSNVISGNEEHGIHFNSCQSNTIAGNYIGTDATGKTGLGNRHQGIDLCCGSRQNVIDRGNIVAYNKGSGVGIWNPTTLYNTITRNSIHSNSDMGISNGDGGNAELSPPALTSITADSVSGVAPVAYATIEIFSDDEDEGRVYEGTTTADAGGFFSFSKAAPFTGPYLTATATDGDGNTSGFSSPVAVPGPISTSTPTPTPTPTSSPTPSPTPTATNTPWPGGDPYEPDNTCATANTIAPDGVPQQHNFHVPEDADWLRFQAAAGTDYIVSALHVNDNAHPIIRLYEHCNAEPILDPGDTFGFDQIVTFHAEHSGLYFMKLSHLDPTSAGEDTAYQISVRPVTTGAAIIAGGRLYTNEQLQAQITFMTNRAYDIFRQAGYEHDAIFYMSADPDRPPHMDAPSLPANLRYAIETWAPNHVKDGEPLFVYLADHGENEFFFLDTGDHKITPDDLDTWLLGFEGQRPNSLVAVIIEACRSGSFITPLGTISHPGRVVVTAAGENTDAYIKPSGQGGAFFSDAFFSALAQNYDVWQSYEIGRQAVREKWGDVQTPWIDGNGNGLPFPPDADDEGAGRRLGLGRVAGLSGQAPFIEGPAVPQPEGDSPVLIQVKVLDENPEGMTVWMEVTKPSTPPPSAPPGYITPVSHAERVDLAYNPTSGRFEVQFTFDEGGAYQFVFNAEDAGGQRAQAVSANVLRTDAPPVYLPLVVRQ